MAIDFQQTLQRLSSKARILAERYNVLYAEKEKCVKQIDDLEHKVEMQQQEIERLKRDLEYLKIASTITPDRKQIEQTRTMISGLVREIDRCILELND